MPPAADQGWVYILCEAVDELPNQGSLLCEEVDELPNQGSLLCEEVDELHEVYTIQAL